MMRVRTVVILLAAVALAGCREIVPAQPQAVGQTGTLLVVTDQATWEGPVGEAIREHLAAPLTTLPQPEPALTVQRMDLTDTFFPQIRRQHSVLFVAPYTSDTPTGAFLRARLDEGGRAAIERGGLGIIFRPDLWARNQMVIYATAPDEATLAAKIRANGTEMRRAFDRVNRQRLTFDMFRRGRQHPIEQQLMERHGFAVNVQHDYVVVADTTFETVNRTAGTFIRMRRIADADSWREFFIYYELDPRLERLHPDTVLVLRNRLSRRFVRGTAGDTYVQVENRFPDRRPIVVDTVNFLGRWAIETRGTWYLGDEQGRSAGMGGPFVSYAFYDEDSGRFYLLDGMVFAPRYAKREFLRQMEAIAHTFRTAAHDGIVVADRPPDDRLPPAP